LNFAGLYSLIAIYTRQKIEIWLNHEQKSWENLSAFAREVRAKGWTEFLNTVLLLQGFHSSFYALPLATQQYIKGIKGAAFPDARLLGPNNIIAHIPIWSNWLWAKTHSRFNKLLICK